MWVKKALEGSERQVIRTMWYKTTCQYVVIAVGLLQILAYRSQVGTEPLGITPINDVDEGFELLTNLCHLS